MHLLRARTEPKEHPPHIKTMVFSLIIYKKEKGL
jgi:hypothetical protein